MGNWNRRYVPRRKFRQDEFEDHSLSPPRLLDQNHSYSSGFEDKRVPSWEIEYCRSAKVPWRKILASKKYIVCYPNVQHWDASAGEEALQNAKLRYWAMINGFPPDVPLPDPNTFIDEIDWDPHLDPEIMADLERHLFYPDTGHDIEKNMETTDESQHDNPWERGKVKDAVQGWSRWDDSVNSKNENPWEQSCSRPVDSLKESVWKSGDNSWVQPQGTEKLSLFGKYEQRNSNGDSGYDCNFSCSRGRGFRNNRNESWNVIEMGYHGNSQSYRRPFRDGCRKRDGFQQHGSNYKTSRYHGGNCG